MGKIVDFENDDDRNSYLKAAIDDIGSGYGGTGKSLAKKKKKMAWYDEEGEKSLIKKGKGNFFEQALGTVTDFGLDVAEGFFNTTEGVADTGQYLLADMFSLFGNKKAAKGLRENADFNSFKQIFGENSEKDVILSSNDYRKGINTSSVLGEYGDQIGQGIGTTGAAVGMAGLGAGALGTPAVFASQTSNAATFVPMFLSSYGNTRSATRRAGYDDFNSITASLESGTIDGATELIFGVIPGLNKNSKLGDSIISAIGSGTEKYLGSTAAGVVKNIVGWAGEGAEELLGNMFTAQANDIIHALNKNYTYGMENQTGNIWKDTLNVLKDPETWSEFLTASASAMLTSGGSKIVTESQKNKVIKSYAKDNNMTFKDAKTKLENYSNIFEDVMEKGKSWNQQQEVKEQATKNAQDLMKGMKLTNGQTLDVKSIESAVEERLQQEINDKQERIAKATQEINSTPFELSTEEQLSILQENGLTSLQAPTETEIQQRREELTKNYIDQIQNSDKYSSYQYEKNDKMDSKEVKLRDSAVKYSNNTQEARNLVDTLANIQKTGNTQYELVDTNKLKELGYNVSDDSTINGLVHKSKDGNTIYINVESQKAYETVLGHEITHMLENTSDYSGLRELLYSQKTEAELEKLRNELRETYSEKDVEYELTADLAGELFENENFIKKLSGNRTLLQKMIDFLDGFITKVTGNKEKQRLKAAQKKYIDMYKEMTSNTNENVDNDNVQYSLSTQQQLNDITNQRDDLRQNLFELRRQRQEIVDSIPNYSMFKQYDELTDINKQIDDNVAESKRLYSQQQELEQKLTEEKELKKQQEIEEINKKSTPFKEKQFKLLQKANPMLDDYHTGIRQPGEIMTWQEAMQDAEKTEEGYSWGDFSKEDAQKALDSKKITIYSSYPIKNGVFVSTSLAQAQMYAGGEGSRVYSKTINPDFVAWINVDEGQYANVGRNFENNVQYSIIRANEIEENNYQRLLKKKKSVQDIYLETGLFEGKDGIVRKELDDSNATIKLKDSIFSGGHYKLREVLDFPELYEIYPGLKEYNVTFETMDSPDNLGRLSKDRLTISINNNVYDRDAAKTQNDIRNFNNWEETAKDYELLGFNEEQINREYERLKKVASEYDDSQTYQEKLKSTLLHEIQHFIQDQEGFAHGSNTEYWSAVKRLTAEKLSEYNTDRDNLLNELGWNQRFDEIMSEVKEKGLGYEDMKRMVDDFLYNPENNPRIEELRQIDDALKNLRDRYEIITGRSAFELYQDTYGEQEARNVQERMNMTPEERKRTMPFAGNDRTIFYENRLNKGILNKDIRYSISKQDNQGRNLSVQQLEYFKNSQIRNEKGELEVVYHTTPNKFTIFDTNRAGENTGYDNTAFGSFVTTNKNFSERFGDINSEGKKGNTMEMYANITNPITHPYNAEYKYSGEELDNIVRNWFDAIGETEALEEIQSYVDNGEYDSLYQAYRNIVEFSDESPFEYASDEKETLQGKGYDGVEFVEGLDKDVNYGVGDSLEPVSSYAVFNSNQVKNIDNTSPTTNEDIRYSISKQDSQGRELSEKQQEYFRDSKVRDSEGNLLTVYHGTYNNFTIFDKNKIGSNTHNEGLFGKGFYFTNQETLADGYSKYGEGNQHVKEGYINITNPFVWKSIKTEEQMKQFIEENNIPEGTIRWNQYQQEIHTITEVENERAFSEALEKAGYDGIIYEYRQQDENHKPVQEIVTFNSNQFKAYDNTNPTDDPDIRYSMSNDIAPARKKGLTYSEDVIKRDVYTGQLLQPESQNETQTETELPTREVDLPFDDVEYEEIPTERLRQRIEEKLNRVSDKAIRMSTKDLELTRKEKAQLRDKLSKYKGWSREQLTNAEVYNDIYNMVSDYADRSYIITDEELKAVQKEIRKTPINISPELKNQITDYGDFRKENFGKLRLTDKGNQGVDVVYQELNEMYPQYFKNLDASPADQLYELADFMNRDINTIDEYRLDDTELNNAATQIFNKLITNSLTDGDINELQEKLDKKKISRKDVRAMLRDEMGITIEDIDKGKDISAINVARTDPIRLNEKVFGRELGNKINDATIRKTQHNEADRMRWLNKEREEIKNLGIKPRSAESAAVQKYGEKQYVDKNGEIKQYGDKELAQEFSDKNTQEKIKKAAEVLREKYDNYLDQINSELDYMGYNTIPKRSDYMHHFEELQDVFSKWGTPFNPTSLKENDLPTDINGLTEFNRPGKAWFSAAQQRMGAKTTYDAITGIDQYLEGASNLIYHTQDIQRYRALSEMIRDTYGQTKGFENLDTLSDEEATQRVKDILDNKLSKYAAWLDEQANALAGKKGAMDRSVERLIGRKGYSVMNTLKSQVGSNMTGFNVRSAMTNFISSTIAGAKTNKVALIKGTVSTINNLMHKDGFTDKSDFLTRRYGSDTLSPKLWQKISNAGQIFMNGSDYLTSQIITRSKYFEGLQNGMTEEAAIKYADDFAARVMGDRSKGSTAEVFNSKSLGLISQFQLEVNNQLDYMIHDTKMDYQAESNKAKAAAGTVFTLGQIAGYSYFFNELFEQVTGSRAAFDPIEIIKTLFGVGDDDDKTQEERNEEAILMLLENLPFGNILTGGGRIPISSALPITELITGKDQYGNDKSRKKILEEALPYYISPTGFGQAQKTLKSMKMYTNDLPGSYTDSGNLRFTASTEPADVARNLLFGQWSSKEADDYIESGYKSINSKKVPLVKELGLTSSEYREIQSGLSQAGTLKNEEGYEMYKDEDGDIYYYDKNSRQVYTESGEESSKDITTLTKANKKEAQLNYINSLDLPYKSKNALANDLFGSDNTKDKYGYDKYTETTTNKNGKEVTKTYYYNPDTDTVYNSKYEVVDKDINKLTKVKSKEINLREMNSFNDYEEYTYSTKNEDKYNWMKSNGISYNDYSKSKESKEAYDWAYNNPNSYTLSKTITDDVVSYKKYKEDIDNIKADKTKSGKTISGSRKKKVVSYINKLDLSYEQKLVLFKSIYKSDKKNNKKIVNYINNMDMTVEEKYTALEKLGYKVDRKKGTVR